MNSSVNRHMLTIQLKFSTMSRRNVPSTARFSTQRCLVPPAADRATALARSTSNTKNLLRRRKHLLRWQVGSSLTAQSLSLSSARSTSTSMPGKLLDKK